MRATDQFDDEERDDFALVGGWISFFLSLGVIVNAAAAIYAGFSP